MITVSDLHHLEVGSLPYYLPGFGHLDIVIYLCKEKPIGIGPLPILTNLTWGPS